MDSSFHHAALVFNKHLWEYTNPKGKGTDLVYGLQQMIALLLVSPPPIVDEAYCQTLKQMTKCETQWVLSPIFKSRSIVDRAWDILTLLAFSMLPSDELGPCIEFYVQNTLNTLNRRLPDKCLEVIRLGKQKGPIHEVPTKEAIQSLLVLNVLFFHLGRFASNGVCSATDRKDH